MDLKQIVETLGFFYKETLEPERIDNVLTKASNSVFSLRYAESMESGDWTALESFITVYGDNGTSLFHFTNGVGTKPADYFGNPEMYHTVGTDKIRVRFVSPNDFVELATHKIEYPSKNYPIANVRDWYIKILPIDIRYTTFSYIKKPIPVHYEYTRTRGYVEYSPSGSSFPGWNESNQIQIIMLALQDLGVLVSQEQIKSKINNQN